MLEQIFLQVLNMTFVGSFVILFVLFARLLLKKSPKKYSYLLWIIVLLRLMVPFSVESVLSIIPVNPTPLVQETIYSATPQITTGIQNVDKSINAVLPAVRDNGAGNPMVNWIFFAALLWLVGVAFFVISGAVSLHKTKNTVKNADRWKDNVYRSNEVKIPFVLGLIKPRIYMPHYLNQSEEEYILLHEQTHIKRLDHVIRILSYLVLSLHWFNPSVWIAFWRSGDDMEMSCDESVINKLGYSLKKDYSQSLLNFASGKRSFGMSPLAFGEGNTKGRIKNILSYKKPKFYIILAIAIVVIPLAIGLLLNPESDTGEIDTAADGVMPEWVLESVSTDQEILWAYENGYFLEEPIIEEAEDIRWTVWAVLSDDISTRIVLSIETSDELNPVWRHVGVQLTKIDGDWVDSNASGHGSDGKYVYVAETPASEPGEHVLTLEYEMFTSAEDEGTIVAEKEIPFNNEPLAALNTTFQVEESVQIETGSITIDKVVYTPSMILVQLTPQGTGVEPDYGRPDELGPYLEIDGEQIVWDGHFSREYYGDQFSYYLSYPKPDEIMEIQMVLPALVYNKEVNMTFTSSDIGSTKSSEGMELTLQDWSINDERLELNFHNSGTEDILGIPSWNFSGIDQEPNRFSFENDENPSDWTIQFGYDENPIIWEQVDAITINSIRTVQEGPWMIEFPVE